MSILPGYQFSRAQFGGELVGFNATDLALAQSVDAVELTEAERQDDLVFKRLCLSIDLMICEAKQALDQSTKTGVKVLSSFDMCKVYSSFFL